MIHSVTRGNGLLEDFLARQRHARANALIPQSLREGAVLDVGCGNFPYFLTRTDFKTKVGLDRIPSSENVVTGVRMVNFDLTQKLALPFSDAEFSVVTMLAVVEHLPQENLVRLFQEIRRILKKGGRFVMTTPAFWTDPILKSLSAIGMLSREEIEEHEYLYKAAELSDLLQKSGFAKNEIRHGYFEVFMNMWVTADHV